MIYPKSQAPPSSPAHPFLQIGRTAHILSARLGEEIPCPPLVPCSEALPLCPLTSPPGELVSPSAAALRTRRSGLDPVLLLHSEPPGALSTWTHPDLKLHRLLMCLLVYQNVRSTKAVPCFSHTPLGSLTRAWHRVSSFAPTGYLCPGVTLPAPSPTTLERAPRICLLAN